MITEVEKNCLDIRGGEKKMKKAICVRKVRRIVYDEGGANI